MADTTPLNLVAICGSFRAESYNAALLRAAQRLAGEGVTITQIDITDVPLFNQDVEAAGDPEAVTALKTAVKESDGVLIVTPEYNYGVPAVTKNAVDWLSRPFMAGPIGGKPTGLAGATLGGGALGCSRRPMASVALPDSPKTANSAITTPAPTLPPGWPSSRPTPVSTTQLPPRLQQEQGWCEKRLVKVNGNNGPWSKRGGARLGRGLRQPID